MINKVKNNIKILEQAFLNLDLILKDKKVLKKILKKKNG